MDRRFLAKPGAPDYKENGGDQFADILLQHFHEQDRRLVSLEFLGPVKWEFIKNIQKNCKLLGLYGNSHELMVRIDAEYKKKIFALQTPASPDDLWFVNIGSIPDVGVEGPGYISLEEVKKSLSRQIGFSG